MKIYHYTSIETLELILKNKKIRFNRLDKVDDMEESIYGSGPNLTKIGIYAFVSCWTKSEKENPALWKMYTDYKGVRIALDAMPFKTYKAKDGFTSFFQEEMNFGSDYFILSFCNEAKLHDVIYVDNPEEEIKNIIKSKNGDMLASIYDLGLYKRKEWAMQQESRFKIIALPADCNGAIELSNHSASQYNVVMGNIFNSIIVNIAKNKPITPLNFDMDLDPVKLSDIEITMGPMTTEDDRIIVENLLNPYHNAKIYNSKLLIREKSDNMEN